MGAIREARLVHACRMGSPLRVAHVGDVGYELMGGCLPSVAGPAAQFMYQESGGQATDAVRGAALMPGNKETVSRYAQERGVSEFYWAEGRLAYARSGERGRHELLRVAHAAHAEPSR